MKANQYQEEAMKTLSGDYHEIGFRMGGKIDLIHAQMGICTEAGEFADALKKYIFYGKGLDETNMIEELGDLLWYIAIACQYLNIDLESVMEENINKLQQRYKGEFTEKEAIERADKND